MLTSPVIRCVRKRFPQAEIHFLTKTKFLSLVEGNPYLNKCWSINHSTKEIILAIKAQKFDFIIDLHKNFRTVRLKKELKIPVYSFDKLNFKKWLLTKFKINWIPKIHLVDRYFEGLKKLGVENDLEGLDFFIPENLQLNKGEKIPHLQEPFAVFVIGAAHQTKSIPVKKAIEILKEINLPVVLLGGPNDIDKSKKIAVELKNSGKTIYNMCGALSLQESAYVIKISEVVITPDTGMMHIAAAFKKNIISVWGNTVPDFGMYPYLPGFEEKVKIAEVKNLSCRPCSKIGYSKCPKSHFNCMNQINAKEISAWANELLVK